MTFPAFYEMRRGRKPFPWMARLAERFVAGDLPDVIDLPTGSGKSDLVIIWAWARKLLPTLPRRLWMVSDRRVIVDQTFIAAQSLVQDGVLVSRLRGGIHSDTQALLDPVVPQVICATVDQLGSRLLFRGYGASPSSWPIWAALAGNDSLIVLDEAHLSPTAEDTIRACIALGADAHLISMTATPRCDGGDHLAISDQDRADPILGARLSTRRMVELREGGSLVDAAQELLSEGCAKVAIICNTVREARRVFDAVSHPDKHLIIGRQRVIDRDRLMSELLPRVVSGSPTSEPLVVVSTQCVEAGADFDFDGMASEICPVDALRQRLGRLDRLGQRGEAKCILTMARGTRRVAPYGTAPVATWRWLATHSRGRPLDLGNDGWERIRTTVPTEALSAAPSPVSFLEPHLRALSITSPRPRVEPDIDLLLHGPGRSSGAVSLVWRRDVGGDPEVASEILSIMPPSATETCEVPLWEVRAWLASHPVPADAGDIEGGLVDEPDTVKSSQLVLRWDGMDEGASLVSTAHLRPGDVIVLPVGAGGYDQFGWAPSSMVEVEDVADEAFERRTGRPVTRLDDPEADVPVGRVVRWTGGTVVIGSSTGERSSGFVEVPLSLHAEAVAAEAEQIATALGLDPQVLRLAGLHHDDGKADPRWQLCIKGGDLSRLGEPPLAKGNYVSTSLARLPVGWRHEAVSLLGLPTDVPDLVRWIIATHHGYGRPFWPTNHHGIGLAVLMTQLQRSHGYWGVALYEAALRWADRSVSQREVANA